MEVKNFVITNCDAFVNSLVQELIYQGISYTQIDNEIHFLDHIFRFYDVTTQEKMQQVQEDALVLVVSEGVEQLKKQTAFFQDPEKMLSTSMSKADSFIGMKKECSLRDPFSCSGGVFMLDDGKKSYHKQMIKKQNRSANIRLKNNIR